MAFALYYLGFFVCADTIKKLTPFFLAMPIEDALNKITETISNLYPQIGRPTKFGIQNKKREKTFAKSPLKN